MFELNRNLGVTPFIVNNLNMIGFALAPPHGMHMYTIDETIYCLRIVREIWFG